MSFAHNFSRPRECLMTLLDAPFTIGGVLTNMDFWKEMHFVPTPNDRVPITVNRLVHNHANTANIVDQNKVIFSKHDTMRLVIYWPGYEVFQEDISVGPPANWSGNVIQERHMKRVISLGRLMVHVGKILGKFLEKERHTPISHTLDHVSISAHPDRFNEGTIAPIGLKRLGANQFQVLIAVYEPARRTVD